jgi:SAM-dependent methyltransferase
MLFRPNPDTYVPHLPSWRQPLYLHLRPLWLALAEKLGTCSGRILDVGCGMQPYRPLIGPGMSEYIGLDQAGPLAAPSVIGSAESLPFEAESFDVVVATQVFEHLPHPQTAVGEAARVLRPGGRLIITVPGVWPTHEAPHDYWRFTRHGLVELIQCHGLRCEELRSLGGTWATIGQMANLELAPVQLLRQLVPLVNILASALDARGAREDLVLNWLVDAIKPPAAAASKASP